MPPWLESLRGASVNRCSLVVWLGCALLSSCSSDRHDTGAIRPSGSQAPASSLQDPPFEPPRRSIRLAVSVIDLLARPERYEGKLVRVAGALSSDTRGIFVTAEHAKLGLVHTGSPYVRGPATGQTPTSRHPPTCLATGEITCGLRPNSPVR